MELIVSAQISIDREQIAVFCRHHHIRKLALFGSVLREDFSPDSDVDVLIEFDPDHVPGLFGLVEMQDELSQIVGQQVDLITYKSLIRRLRDHVIASSEVQYAEG